MKMLKKHPVGEVRPSQLLLSYGVGALMDLPHISALIMGLDDWDITNSREISEERLLNAVQGALGSQVARLYMPPIPPSSANAPQNPFDSQARIGVPVSPFPRWMLCPACRLLAPMDAGYFELKTNPFQPDRARYIHQNCNKARQPTVLPSRFMIACEGGHLDDFPHHEFVHGALACKSTLRLYENGVTGEPSDIIIKCEICSQSRPMSDAFRSSEDEDKRFYPTCRARRPHLRDFEPGECKHETRTVLLSASNNWFPLYYSTLSIPAAIDTLGQLVEAHWSKLQNIAGAQDIATLRRLGMLGEHFALYSDEDVWEKIAGRKEGSQEMKMLQPGDLKQPEWQVLSHPASAPRSDDFELTPASVPDGYDSFLQQVVLVERLREVRALTGFTRIESLSDYAEEDELPTDHIMPLSRRAPNWVPAAEVRGEGIFLQFREDALQQWLQRLAVQQQEKVFFESHTQWRRSRRLVPPEANFPFIRYVLLHTFAHALMRRLTLECGYTAASIRERIYARPPESDDGPMAGILLYTSAADSAGTLGGLVSLGRPEQLGWHMEGALEDMRHCASDPLCAEHSSRDDHTLHEAACHACMFIPETSCERGNRYLDRSVLVRTVERDDLAFFKMQ